MKKALATPAAQFAENPHCLATILLSQQPVDMHVFM
jgi:hypothetical protein